uniref:Uncharacterized protein n=1 Tax=Anopheles atroparvus TaxID=41427 RepID=A0A182IWQ1_ANOAO
MVRVEKTEDTPKKRPSEWAESGIGSTEATTKSGRKVKRPAHLGSPERSPEPAVTDGKKSVARQVKTATDIADSPAKVTPKRRALTKTEDIADEANGPRKTIGSTRKTVASLTETPKKAAEKEVDRKQNPDAVDDSGTSKSGRKIKVPAKLIDFESEIITSPRKALSGTGEMTLASAKTPGRASRLVKKPTTDDATVHRSEDEPVRNRAGRGKSVAAMEGGGRSTPRKAAVTANSDSDSEVTSSRAVSPSPAPPKTPGRRAKSVAPMKAVKTAQQTENSIGTPKTTRTPGRRAKSVAPTKAMETAQQTENSIDTPKTTRTPGRPAVASSVMKMRANSPEVSPKFLGRETAHTKPEETEAEKEDTHNAPMTGRTPGRSAGRALIKQHVDSPAASLKPGVRIGRSLAPTQAASESVDEPEREIIRAGKTPGRTPGRRAFKSLMPSASIPSVVDEQDDPKPSTSTTGIVERPGALVEYLSRSGRKLKPKKIFEIEQEESFKHKQQIDDGNDSIGAGGRKRKLDNVDDAPKPVVGVMSPRKKISTGKDARLTEQVQSFSQAKRKPEFEAVVSVEKLVLKKPAKKPENISAVTNTPTKDAPPAIGKAEAPVSRSGRKIKSKKMFGFDDGDASDPSMGHVTSPSKATTTKITKEKPSTKSESMETSSPADKFVTKRGVNDHHPKAKIVAVDEPDRAVQSSVQIPDIIVSSPVMETFPLKQDNVVKIDAVSTPLADDSVRVADTSTDTSGSNRSGRKIKHKKFYGDDDDVAAKEAVGQATNSETNKERKISTTVAPEVASSPTVNDEQQVDKAPSTQSLAEEETNVVHSTVVDQDEGERENVVDMDKEPGVDIAEGGPVVPSISVESAPVDVKASVTESTIAEEKDVQSTEKPDDQKVDPDHDMMEQKGMDVAEGPTKPEQHSEDNMRSGNAIVLADPSESDAIENVPSQSDASVHCSGTSESAHEEKDVLGHVEAKNAGSTVVEDNGAVLDGAATEQKEDTGNVIAAVETFVAVSEIETNSLQSPTDPPPEKETISDLQKHEVSCEGSIEELKVGENDLLADVTFGEIEYLEDEEPNVVDHIRKPTSRAMSEEMQDTALVPSIKITQSKPTPAATAPHTPVSKADGRNADSKCSPDKPPEIIEILDSPAAMAFCRQIDDNATGGTAVSGGGSATSTPLPAKALMTGEECLLKEGVVGKLVHEGRKRSLSASAADMTLKRNVTFHSPANSTVLVDAIDERLVMKSMKSGTKSSGPRKRSLSEHKPSHEEPKPSKISRKVPNFKNIHANHFDRMESIAEFMKRKEQRAKVILTAASPATKLLSRPAGAALAEADVAGTSTEKKASAQKPFVFKSGGGSVALFGKANTAVVQPRPKATNIARPVLTAASRAAAMAAKLKAANPDTTTDGRLANRLQQFKPKQHAPDAPTSGTMDATSSTQRPVEQLRQKQSKILKGVRTNRRFELQMKHRDNLQHP